MGSAGVLQRATTAAFVSAASSPSRLDDRRESQAGSGRRSQRSRGKSEAMVRTEAQPGLRVPSSGRQLLSLYSKNQRRRVSLPTSTTSQRDVQDRTVGSPSASIAAIASSTRSHCPGGGGVQPSFPQRR